MYGDRKIRYSPNLQEIVRGSRNDYPPSFDGQEVTECNTDYWKLILNRKRNFSWTPPKTPVDYDAYIRQMITRGNLICTQPRVNGYMYGLT